MDWIALEGKSMMPFLDAGDRVGVKWLSGDDWNDLVEGDVVLGRNPQGGWILHRILSCPRVAGENPEWVTKGDSSITAETFARNELWGRVVAVKRGEEGPEILLQRSRLDFWIARFSRYTQLTNSTRLAKAFCRRAARGLGWLRRRFA